MSETATIHSLAKHLYLSVHREVDREIARGAECPYPIWLASPALQAECRAVMADPPPSREVT